MPTSSAAKPRARLQGGARGKTRGAARRLGRTRVAPLVAPSALLMALVFLIPILIVLWVSVHRMDYFEVGEFAGLGQYADLLRSASFWMQLKVTLIYVFGTLALSIAAG